MKKLLFALVSLGLFAACSGPRAVTNHDGSSLPVMLLFDAGWEQIDRENPNHVDQRQSIENYYKENLLESFKNAGYEAVLIDNLNEASNPDIWVIEVKITNYNPGSKAARMLVGFGAGAAVLDTYVRVGKSGDWKWMKDYSYGTSGNWQKTIVKSNKVLLKDLETSLAALVRQ
ncbi:MAG: DUF4410 domain-containing protein [Fibrobacter sp.]|jgi:ABC-type glycerol-3-phosphate transport system substrate-binding protein|nr:DUF4410 domain-containing protein [Fibrobacter sp.]